MNAAVLLERVSAGYGKTTVLDQLDVIIAEHSFVIVTGSNGSGKSTLLKVICGVLAIHDGEARVLDISLMNPNGRRSVRRNIGYVSQIQHEPKIALTVIESVLLGRWGSSFSWLKRSNEQDMEKAEDALRLTGALDLASRDIRSLSGGQRQKVTLARALARSPSLLLMDEPTTYLDPEAKSDFMHLIRRLHESLQFTAIIVTHEPIERKRSDRLFSMRQGKLFELTGEQRSHLWDR
ncbi:MAG: ABC transporter ATP-binding protein [Sphaerochaetaceae bacterium]